MESKNCYEELVTEYKAIASVGTELKSKIESCRKNAEKYEEVAKELEAQGKSTGYYHEWAEENRREIKYWIEAERMFRTKFLDGNSICVAEDAIEDDWKE